MNTIRLARPEELDAIWALVQRTVAEMISRGSDQWGEDYPFPGLYADDIAHGELWCVTDGEEGPILGVAAIICRHETDYENIPFRRSEPAVSLHRIAVDPAAQRQGVATMLFEKFHQEGARLGVDNLRVDTYDLNAPMQNLIRQQGFTHIGDTHFPKRPLPYHCYDKLLPEEV